MVQLEKNKVSLKLIYNSYNFNKSLRRFTQNIPQEKIERQTNKIFLNILQTKMKPNRINTHSRKTERENSTSRLQ